MKLLHSSTHNSTVAPPLDFQIRREPLQRKCNVPWTFWEGLLHDRRIAGSTMHEMKITLICVLCVLYSCAKQTPVGLKRHFLIFIQSSVHSTVGFSSVSESVVSFFLDVHFYQIYVGFCSWVCFELLPLVAWGRCQRPPSKL